MKIKSDIITTIKQGNSFLGHIHLSPDPDTIGSSLALKLALESEGKAVHLFCEDPLIESAAFLPQIESVEHTSMANALSHSHDVYLSLDTAKWELATHNDQTQVRSPLIVIDHHPDNTMKSKLRWVEPNSSSVAQMVFKLLRQLKIEITPQIATCLLFGLLGDTGLFQNTNTKSQDFAAAQELMELGADYHSIVLHQARSYSASDLACMGKALSNLKLSKDGLYAWMLLDYKTCNRADGEPKIGFIANMYAGRVAGTEFGAVIAEKEKGITKGSLRSRVPEFDVSAIARHLGGGGHKNAASFKLELSAAEAETKFLEAVRYIKNAND